MILGTSLGTIAQAVSRIEARLGRQESAKDISWDVGFETPAGVTRGGGGNHDQVAQIYRETMTITPNAKVFSPSQRTAETKTVYAPLSKGPAFQLGRGGEDESRRAGLCHTLLNLPGIKDGLIALAAATRIEIRDRGQLEELTADEIKTNV
jgi:hypothetical protein